MSATLKIPEISDEERTPLVTALLEIVQIQQELIQELRDEIARLKGQKPKPGIKHSTLGSNSRNKSTQGRARRRVKRNKTERLEIHETVVLKAQTSRRGARSRAMTISRFKPAFATIQYALPAGAVENLPRQRHCSCASR